MKYLIAIVALLIVACGPPAPGPTNSPSATDSASPSASASPSTSPQPVGACLARVIDVAAEFVLPDARCTPGAVDGGLPISSLCPTAHTRSIRPPVSYTNALKAQQMKEYGYTDSISLHEEDHLIPLELGGAPKDPKNLWPEPGKTPNPKDKLENYLHAQVCSSKMTLAEAQTAIATDWVTAYRKAGL